MINKKGQAEGTATLEEVVKWIIRVLFFTLVGFGLYYLLSYITT